MSNFSPGKTEVRKMIGVLERDFDTAEDAAKAVLEAAWDMYEGKGKWTVFAQRKRPDEPPMSLALGWYGTENQARAQAEGMAFSSVTHEEYGYRVLPVFHGTAASWHAARKTAQKDSEKSEREQRLLESIADWVAEVEARATTAASEAADREEQT